jgi:hypothetical protein
MEPEGSLPCSEQSAICPYHEPDELKPHISVDTLISMPMSLRWALPFRFSKQIIV